MIERKPVHTNRAISALLFTAITLTLPRAGLAGPGHDHGDAVTAAIGSTALPRFAATSETFELVGVLQDKQLTLYLDRANDNSPVKDAQLQLELGGSKVDVKPHGEGEFQATLSQPLKRGIIPVTATVVAGADTDLLGGELDLHAGDAEHAAHTHTWKEYALWIAAGLGSLALFAWAMRFLMRRRSSASGGLR
jgi:hypothetical protein